MKKTILSVLIAGCTLATGCNSDDPNHFTVAAGSDDTSYLADVKACPKAHLRQKDVSVTQFEASEPLFEIQLLGYDGYCDYNDKTGKYKATVKPRFRLTRLSDSDVTDVHFSYYLETVEGPTKYLGKKTFFESVTLARGQQEYTYTSKGGEILIPEPGSYNLDIYLGLYARKVDSELKN